MKFDSESIVVNIFQRIMFICFHSISIKNKVAKAFDFKISIFAFNFHRHCAFFTILQIRRLVWKYVLKTYKSAGMTSSCIIILHTAIDLNWSIISLISSSSSTLHKVVFLMVMFFDRRRIFNKVSLSIRHNWLITS